MNLPLRQRWQKLVFTTKEDNTPSRVERPFISFRLVNGRFVYNPRMILIMNKANGNQFFSCRFDIVLNREFTTSSKHHDSGKYHAYFSYTRFRTGIFCRYTHESFSSRDFFRRLDRR